MSFELRIAHLPVEVACSAEWRVINFTAPMAMPTPKTIPASIFFDWPSP
jgi:hypothetical protein